MNNEELVKHFYSNLKEFEGGLTNLIYNLKDEYQDGVQNTLESLIRYNNKYGIKKNTAKGFMFVALKNKLIQLNDRRIKRHTIDLSIVDEPSIENGYQLSEIEESLLKRLKMIIGDDSYKMLLKYYDNRYVDEYDEKLTRKVQSVKKEIGYRRQYEVVMPDGKIYKSLTLKDIAERIGINQSYMCNILYNNILIYKGNKYIINTIVYNNIKKG